jgi:hypothetical protein
MISGMFRHPLAAAAFTIALAVGPSGTRAQQLDYDEIAKRPGYTVTKTIEDGHEVVRIRKETVVITIDSKGMIGIDRSGAAVLCFWDIYVNLKVGADYCFPDSERELKEDSADAVERFKDFIVANSLTPITRDSLDAYVERQRAELASRGPKTATGQPHCTKLDSFEYFQTAGRDKRRAEVAKILAVPRPPVLNPCF